jgi:hypothetical protein
MNICRVVKVSFRRRISVEFNSRNGRRRDRLEYFPSFIGRVKIERELAVTWPWSSVLNAFPTLSCILSKLKRCWNTHETFILLTRAWNVPVTMRDCHAKSHQLSFSFDRGLVRWIYDASQFRSRLQQLCDGTIWGSTAVSNQSKIIKIINYFKRFA